MKSPAKRSFSKKGEEALQKIIGNDTRSVPDPPPGVLMIPVKDIGPNPFQPRILFDEEKLTTLSDSMKDKGILQPIIVRRCKKSSMHTYELIAGERRLRAAKLAGLISVAAILKDVGDKDIKVLTLVENWQREDLNVVEKMLHMGVLLDEFGDTGEVAKAARITRRSVERYIKIFKGVSASETLLSFFKRNPHKIDFRAAEDITNICRHLRPEEHDKFVALADSEGIKRAIKCFRHRLSSTLGPTAKGQHTFCVTKETTTHVLFHARHVKEEKINTEDREKLQKGFSDFLRKTEEQR